MAHPAPAEIDTIRMAADMLIDQMEQALPLCAQTRSGYLRLDKGASLNSDCVLLRTVVC
jgi:hypothetical protein